MTNLFTLDELETPSAGIAVSMKLLEEVKEWVDSGRLLQAWVSAVGIESVTSFGMIKHMY